MLDIKSIPAFNDNYIWLIENSDQHCAVVDPGDAAPVIRYLEQHNLTLDAILITHHHNDHIGGVPELVRQFPHIDVVGPANEPVPTLTHAVEAGEQIELFGEILSIRAGSTKGHIGYVGDGKLFCGDVLFSRLGRFLKHYVSSHFIKQPVTLKRLRSLRSRYTASNVAFALAVEPDNPLLQSIVMRKPLQAEKPTVPTTIGKEKHINPFLRLTSQVLFRSRNRTKHDSLAIFTALREWKNEF